jgi:hypothetical protein
LRDDAGTALALQAALQFRSEPLGFGVAGEGSMIQTSFVSSAEATQKGPQEDLQPPAMRKARVVISRRRLDHFFCKLHSVRPQ